MTSTDRYLDLIDAAYDVSENPHRFEDLLSIASRYLFAFEEGTKIAEDLPRHAGRDERLESHAGRINKLLKTNLKQTDAAPANLFHARLRLKAKTFSVNGNLAAEQLLGVSFPCAIDALPFDHKMQGELMRLISAPPVETLAPPHIILANVEAPVIRSCLALIETSDDETQSIYVSISYVDWSPELLNHLSEAFDLSPGETAVLQGFLNRYTQKDIAESRQRSIETIKVQSSSILRKTGCSRMSEVVELSASIAYLLRQSSVTAPPQILGTWLTPRDHMKFIKLPSGRKLAYYVYGKGSIPVLFMHGYIFGPFFTPAFLKALDETDMYIIAPSRPGFGYSSPSISRRSFNTETVNDSVALIEHLGLTNIIMAVHQGGASHAFRIANALEGKVDAMLMISSGIPIDEDKHVPHMDIHARMGAVTCRHAPSVMKMMTQISMQMYKRKGAKAFLNKYYSKSPIDAIVLRNDENMNVLIAGTYHISQQGSEVWVRDGQSAMGDWQNDFEAVSCFQSWIHGAQCPVLKAEFVSDYVSEHTEFDVEIMPDAGINLLYQHPERVIEKLNELSKFHKKSFHNP